MSDYARVLGDVVKVAREKEGLTQAEVASAIDRDPRTVLNIENYKGNPKLEVLYLLVRTLKIDARDIFNPELQCDTPALHQLYVLISACSEEDAKDVGAIGKKAWILDVNRMQESARTVCIVAKTTAERMLAK